jgi:hypothetical protein
MRQGNKVAAMRIGFCRPRRQGVNFRLPRGIFALPLFLLLLSCSRTEELRLAPPAMAPLSREEIGYGVVNVSYTHAADKPGGRGASLGYLRRGSVVRILERRIPGGTAVEAAGGASGRRTVLESWVLVEGGGAGFSVPGWLPESVIDVYSTEAQAETAAETLLE